ncbi:TPA: hypothetical protein ACGW1K_004263 [Stenotrophomonas maltophilia]
MLSDFEQERLVELLVATAEVIGDRISPSAAVFMVSDLAQYPLPMLERALASCRRELKARLSLAAILERIEDGHPAPNEAWANAIRAADEGATVVWTEQTRDAWAVALPLVQAGDKIAARPAFLEVYTRLVKEARAAHRIATYQLSLERPDRRHEGRRPQPDGRHEHGGAGGRHRGAAGQLQPGRVRPGR